MNPLKGLPVLLGRLHTIRLPSICRCHPSPTVTPTRLTSIRPSPPGPTIPIENNTPPPLPSPDIPPKPPAKNEKSPPARRRIIVVLDENDIEEKFIKGSGPGGQKINKRMHNVQLFHKPTGIRIECQRFRELVSNRKEARKILKQRLDVLVNGDLSTPAKRIAKKQKQKAKAKQRAKKKANAKAGEGAKGSECAEDEDAEGDDDREEEEGEEDEEEAQEEEEEEQKKKGRKGEGKDSKLAHHEVHEKESKKP
ncbi:hypothetical protein HK097_002491 [Rhizophlyctis rosea]|uniref:Prokaryotic-type class I peptide chain release factors domain-containing protein n=1 Tax=Rhizophlyctis rosea TaxID=64517 RepID=A0AAD5SMU4_9FUNG|nr:hypothetical protein HK097_002491 [Rhizophlyctis rosea]